MDVNLRSNMDEAGYLPIAYLCNYENVAYFGALYCDIIDALANSSSLEIDQQNEVVRVTDNWKMVSVCIFFYVISYDNCSFYCT